MIVRPVAASIRSNRLAVGESLAGQLQPGLPAVDRDIDQHPPVLNVRHDRKTLRTSSTAPSDTGCQMPVVRVYSTHPSLTLSGCFPVGCLPLAVSIEHANHPFIAARLQKRRDPQNERHASAHVFAHQFAMR